MRTTARPVSLLFLSLAAALSPGLAPRSALAGCDVTALVGGTRHSLVLRSDGGVWGWGENRWGQLALSDLQDRNQPVTLPVTGATSVAAGGRFSLALMSNGTVRAWGSNAYNELGQGSAYRARSSATPVAVQLFAGGTLAGVVAVSAGSQHGMALLSDGQVMCWGDNSHGQLGIGGTNTVAAATGAFLSNVIAIAAGSYHSLALKSDGTLWSWGSNASGQLGRATTELYDGVPGQVSLASVSAIASGGNHSVALLGTGAVMAWGDNRTGQIGDGTRGGSKPTPTAVLLSGSLAPLTNVTAVAAGLKHSLAVKSDGTAWAWGHNIHGQLGAKTSLIDCECSLGAVQVVDSSTTNQALTGISRVAAGGLHSLAYAQGGTLWAFGLDDRGQLGDLATNTTGTQSTKAVSALLPCLSVANASPVLEGNCGSRSLSFPITLNVAHPTNTISVNYVAVNGTATAGKDFTAVDGTLTFAPGETAKTVTVPVLPDVDEEPDETLSLVLSGPTNASLQPPSAVGTILNDDRARPDSVWHDWFAVDTRETPYVGDFDGDGKADIITFTRENPLAFGDVYVALSLGDRFGDNTKWHDWFAIAPDEIVAIGDYDGDGKDDIATWLKGRTWQVYVALSFGTGMTQEYVWLDRIGSDPGDVLQAGDANGDGKDDLILFARSQGKVRVALSTGKGFNEPAVWHNWFAVSTYERPHNADFNGDRKADIATFATDSPTAFGDVYAARSAGNQFEDGWGQFKWHDWFSIDPAQIIRTGDINQDGLADVFTFMPRPDVQVYTAQSHGTWLGPNVLVEIPGLTRTATDVPYVADADGDGYADIVVFHRTEGKVRVHRAVCHQRPPDAKDTLPPFAPEWVDRRPGYPGDGGASEAPAASRSRKGTASRP